MNKNILDELPPINKLKNDLIGIYSRNTLSQCNACNVEYIAAIQANNVILRLLELLPRKFVGANTQIVFEEHELPEYSCINTVIGNVTAYFGKNVTASFVVNISKIKIILTFTDAFFI